MTLGNGIPNNDLFILLLTLVIPRRVVVQTLSKKLTVRFGDFINVDNVDPQRLRRIGGLGDTAVTRLN